MHPHRPHQSKIVRYTLDTVHQTNKGRTFGGTVPGFLSPQHPVDSLALIGSEDRDESFVLDVIDHLPALSLVQMPDVIIEFLDILPLQVCVTFLLLVLYNLCIETQQKKVQNSQARYILCLIIIIP